MDFVSDLMTLIEELEMVSGYETLKLLLSSSLLCYYLLPLTITFFLICFLLKRFK